MNFIKNAIKELAGRCGYIIQKQPSAQTELVNFVRNNWWFKNMGILTVFDIGANEGQFARRISYLLPEAHLHCFEPLPDAFTKLKQNLQAHFSVTLYPFALGDTDGEMNINLNEYSASSSFLTMRDTHRQNFSHAIKTTHQQVKIKRLDELRIPIVTPMLIKIDVQGFEDKVINGGLATIKQALIIIIEVSFEELYQNQLLFHSIYEIMHSIGFRYNGNIEQLASPVNGKLLQADAIFINDFISN